MDDFLSSILPVAVLLVGAVAGWGARYVREYVKSTRTTVDDELLAAVEKALRQGRTPTIIGDDAFHQAVAVKKKAKATNLYDFGVIALLLLVVLGGGASLFLTAKYDEVTDTTLVERCEMRHRNIAALEALAADRELSEVEASALSGYKAFVARFCGE